jgi:hypothetical protein
LSRLCSPAEHWGKLLGDTAAVTAMLDRLLYHAHVLTCGPRSWRTRLHSDRNARPEPNDASRFGPGRPRSSSGAYLGIPPRDTEDADTSGLLDHDRTR